MDNKDEILRLKSELTLKTRELKEINELFAEYKIDTEAYNEVLQK